jgi:uncharacterized membrane protein YoaK (UPF0700 family)
MLFGSENISTYTRYNVLIWMILAFQAGLLNLGGLMACHSFVSHVSGYATLFAVASGHRQWGQASGLLLVPVFFMLGAMLSGFLVDLRIKLQRKPRYYVVFGMIFFLQLVVAIGGFNHIFGQFGEPLERLESYMLVALLASICGAQNGLVTLVSKSVVRTTHLTGITTDLGIGLVRVWNRGRLFGKIDDEVRANYMRVGIISSFITGSVAGVRVFSIYEYRGFIFPALISGTLFFLTTYFQVIRKEIK